MKKAIIILFITFLLCTASIFSKTKETKFNEKDSLRFKLLPALNHNVKISLTALDKFIYFTDEIKLKKNDLTEKGMCCFLNNDLKVSEAIVNGNSISIREYINVKAERFDPPIRLQAYTDLKSKTKLYELLFNDFSNLPDTVSLKIKYIIDTQDSITASEVTANRVTLNGNTFWYPRSFNQNESLTLSVKMTDKISALINNSALPYKQKGYLRTSDVRLSDSMESPVDITFIKD